MYSSPTTYGSKRARTHEKDLLISLNAFGWHAAGPPVDPIAAEFTLGRALPRTFFPTSRKRLLNNRFRFLSWSDALGPVRGPAEAGRMTGGFVSAKEWGYAVPFRLRRQQAADHSDASCTDLASRQIEASLLYAATNSGSAERSSVQKSHTRNNIFSGSLSVTRTVLGYERRLIKREN